MGYARVGSNPAADEYREYNKNAWMAERSKAADLSSVIFGCVGSNPTSSKIIITVVMYAFVAQGQSISLVS